MRDYKIAAAQASFKRHVLAEAAVTDEEYEKLARRVASIYNLDWEWSEDHYDIKFKPPQG